MMNKLLLLIVFLSNIAFAKGQSGETIYHDICSTCHSEPSSNAPQLTDKTAWKPRLAKGKKALYKSAFEGVHQSMPAHDQFEQHLRDDEVKRVVDYIIKQVK